MLKASRISENFNIGAPLAFMTQKEAEVHNLIAVSSGVEAAVNPEAIQSTTVTLNLLFFF